MKLLALGLLLMFTIPFYAQDSTSVQWYSSTIGIGEQLKFGNRSIKFKELISDSRCPSDVTCIWPGEAKILVEVFENGNLCGEEMLVISSGDRNTSVSLQKLFSGGDFSLSAFQLTPYPKTSERIKPSEYSINLEVKETLQD